jgi:hypothetical protein
VWHADMRRIILDKIKFISFQKAKLPCAINLNLFQLKKIKKQTLKMSKFKNSNWEPPKTKIKQKGK